MSDLSDLGRQPKGLACAKQAALVLRLLAPAAGSQNFEGCLGFLSQRPFTGRMLDRFAQPFLSQRLLTLLKVKFSTVRKRPYLAEAIFVESEHLFGLVQIFPSRYKLALFIRHLTENQKTICNTIAISYALIQPQALFSISLRRPEIPLLKRYIP